MRHGYRTVLSVLVLLILIVSGSTPVSSGPADTGGKIAPWVMANTADGAEAEFLVVLAAQADLGQASALVTKAEKGRYVYETLWRTAQGTQGPLLAWLVARDVPHRPYYIVNAVWVKGDAALVQTLAARSDVARIEGNPRILNFVPAPPAPFNDLLAAAPDAVEPGIAYVRAPEVWAMGFTGQGVVVGGQDTGYDWTHPALKPHYRGWNGVTANHDYNWHDAIHTTGSICGADAPAPCDDNSHGTHTMGTVVGDDGGVNQIGMAPGAQWIGCRNMDRGYGTPTTYLECFEFFLAPYPVGGTPVQGDPAKAPDVTNNSWTCPAGEGCSWSTLQAAVEAQRAAGILTVVSAGNSGSACSTVGDPPAIYAAAYTVGALTTGTDSIASLSSRGPVTVDGSNRRKPDIVAPGTSVRSSIPGGSYSYKTGTSMAAPHVAGAVALLWSASPWHMNQIAATEQLLNDYAFHIASTACSSSGWPNNVYGYGRLDVKAAVDGALLPGQYGVAISPTRVTQYSVPGTIVSTTFDVVNTGQATDTFIVTITDADWEVDAPRIIGPLGAGSSTTFSVTVHVPGNLLCRSKDMAVVTVTSEADPIHNARANLYTIVDPVPDMIAQATVTNLTVAPGFAISTSLWITNTGNCEDTFSVDTVNLWPLTVADTTRILGVGDGLTLPVVITVPTGTLAGDFDVATLVVTSQADGETSATALVTTTADAVYGVMLSPVEDFRNGDVGTTVIYSLALTNTGNISDAYALALSGAAWATTLTPDRAVLDPAQVVPVTVTVTVPLEAPTGITDTVRLTVSGTGVSAISDLTTAAIAADCLPLMNAGFDYEPVAPKVGELVTFTGRVEAGTQPIVYEWSFGDGTAVATGQVVTHIFPPATVVMPYPVVMTVTNMCSEDLVRQTVIVSLYKYYLPLIRK